MTGPCARCQDKEGEQHVLIFGKYNTMITEPPDWAGFLCDDCVDVVRQKIDTLLPSYR